MPGTRPACEEPKPVWECTSSSLGENALETWDGATSEKTTFPEPPTRSRTEILGLEQTTPKGSGTPGRQREENPVQIAVSESEKSVKPTSDGEARGQPDAEAGNDDGGDDTWYVSGPRLQHRGGLEKRAAQYLFIGTGSRDE